ncbi:MAG TPA: hypothetical protein VMH49_00955 [Thermoplasmata archaeon]|nr:hypothetical protein [Thermoplasmata archaeon]
MGGPSATTAPSVRPRGRCRCGHYPSQHMVTRAIPGSSNVRLEPSGPCVLCGEGTCRVYAPSAGAV